MTPAIRILPRTGIRWTAIFAAALLFAPPPPRSAAQELDFSAQEQAFGRERPGIRKLFVPRDQPEQWPEGPWQPMPVEEFERLMEAARRPSPAPAAGRIERAEYSATLEGDALRDGSFVWQVQNRAVRPELLSLEPLNLAVTELSWSERRAVWGTHPDGSSALLLDPGRATATGRWNLQGRAQHGRLVFDVGVPPATVTQLRLLLSDGMSLSSSTGQVTDPEEADETGRSIWLVDLGGESSCRLTVTKSGHEPAAPPVVLFESELSYAIRDDGLQLQARLDLEVAQGALDSLRLRIPGEVEVFAVTYGGEADLPLESTRAGNDTRVIIPLPVPLRGKSRPFRIQAVAPGRVGEPWELPLPRLENSVFMSGRLHVSVRNPLELKSYEAGGCRQTAMLSAADGESFTFEQQRADARLALLTDHREIRLSARTVAHLRLDPENRLLTEMCRWKADSGSAFRARYALSEQWDVVAVNLRGSLPEAEPPGWRVVPGEGGGRLLYVDLREPIAAQNPKQIDITVRQRAALSADASIVLPVLRPLDCASVECVIAVSPWPDETFGLDTIGAFAKVDPGGAPEFARESSVWSDLSFDEEPGALVLHTVDPGASARLAAERSAGTSTPVDGQRPITSPKKDGNAEAGEWLVATRSPVDLAALELRSVLATGGGHDIHWARFEIDKADETDSFRCRLAQPAQLVAVRLNGEMVRPLREGEHISVSLAQSRSRDIIEIRYSTPSTAGAIRQRRRVIVPRALCKVIDFEWTFALPEDERLVATPEFLVLHDPISQPTWTERFFGPPGRKGSRGLFNPFRADSWRNVFGPKPGEQPAARQGAPNRAARENRAELDDWSAPARWVVRRASGSGVPEIVSLQTGNDAAASRLGWAAVLGCLIFGLAMRATRLPAPRRLLVLWLSMCVVAAWKLPGVYALIFGGAVTGTLLAILFPAGLLRSVRIVRIGRDGVPAGSTVLDSQIPVSVSSILFAAGIGLAATSALFAQPQPSDATESPPGTTGDDFRLLVPVDSEFNRSARLGVVYATPDLVSYLRSAAERQSHTEYLISAADYDVELRALRSATVVARYRVAVLSDEAEIKIDLPISGVHLGGRDACTVNGRPQPVLSRESEDGYVVPLEAAADRASPGQPAKSAGAAPPENAEAGSSRGQGMSPVRTYEIALRLHPPIEAVAGGGRFEFGIPRVASSRLTLDVDDSFLPVAVFNSEGDVTTRQTDDDGPIELGMTDSLRVVWSSEEPQSDASTALEAGVTCTVDVRPTWLEYRYHVAYNVVRGAVDSIVWRLPQGFVLRGGETPELPSTTTSYATDRATRIVVTFPAAHSGQFVVDATFAVPARRDGRWITVPAPDVLSAADTGQMLDVSLNQIGVSAVSDYRLESSDPNDDRVTQISPESFLENGAGLLGVNTPEVAYRLEGPAELKFRLEAQQPQRKIVWQNYVGVVGRESLSWTYNAEIEMTSGEAFQHRLSVDPRLEVREASVREAGAERLLRWTHIGKELTLFLGDKTTGVQNISISGTLPLSAAVAAELPALNLQGAEPAESELLLYRTAGTALTVGGRERFEQVAGRREPQGDERSGRVLFARLAIAAGQELPTIRAVPREEERRADSITRLFRSDEGRWEISTIVRVHGVAESSAPVRIRVPTEIGGTYELEPAELLLREDLEADGTRVAVLQPTADEKVKLSVTITAEFVAAIQGSWSVPIVGCVDARGGEHYLVVPAQQGPVAFGSSARRLAMAEFPRWVVESAGLEPETDQWAVYRTDSLPWQVRRPQSETDSVQAQVSLVHTQLWLRRRGLLVGCTEIYLSASDESAMELLKPDDVGLDALFVDGYAVEPQSRQEEVISVELARSDTPHVIVVHWTQNPPDAAFGLRRLDFQPPQLINRPPERSVVTLVRPGQSPVVFQDGMEQIAPFEFAMTRLEGLLPVVRALPESSPARAAVRPLLLQLGEQFDRQLRLEAAETSTGAERKAEASRVAAIRRQLEQQRGTAAAGGASSSWPSSLLGKSLSNSLAAFDRRAVHGRWKLSGDDLAAPMATAWLVDEVVIATATALLGLLIAVPICSWVIRPNLRRWLDSYELLSWTLVGVFWWVCLAASALGLLVLLATLVIALRRNSALSRPAARSYGLRPDDSLTIKR